MSATLHFVNQLGHTLDVTLPNVASIEVGERQVDSVDALSVMRYYGTEGWSPTSIPAGGIHLPYAMAETFDWALIGARSFKMGDDVMVAHLGNIYTRREFAEDKKKDMPAAIKYSRGASATDPEAIIEPTDGKIGRGFVTLAIFKGGGPIIHKFTVQRAAPRSTTSEASKREPYQGARPVPESEQQQKPAPNAGSDPLVLLTEGQRGVVLKKARERGIDVDTPEGIVVLRGLVRTVMPKGEAEIDAAHLPMLFRAIQERSAA